MSGEGGVAPVPVAANESPDPAPDLAAAQDASDAGDQTVVDPGVETPPGDLPQAEGAAESTPTQSSEGGVAALPVAQADGATSPLPTGTP